MTRMSGGSIRVNGGSHIEARNTVREAGFDRDRKYNSIRGFVSIRFTSR